MINIFHWTFILFITFPAVFETCESLTDEYKLKAKALFNKYRPIEDNTQMTVSEKLPYIEEWWRESELLLKGLRFQYEDIEKSIEKANAKLRYLWNLLVII